MGEASEIVTNIIVTPAVVYYAPYGTAVPADTVAAGTAWGGSWVKMGYTKTPLAANYETEELDVEIEQSIAPVDRVKTKEALTLETMLAELYLDGVNLGAGGTNTPTAAGAGQPGKEELTVGGTATLTKRAFGFEGTYVDEDGATFPVRVFVWRATARLNGALEFGKADTTGVPLQIKAVADMTKSVGQRLFKISKILEPATS